MAVVRDLSAARDKYLPVDWEARGADHWREKAAEARRLYIKAAEAGNSRQREYHNLRYFVFRDAAKTLELRGVNSQFKTAFN